MAAPKTNITRLKQMPANKGKPSQRLAALISKNGLIKVPNFSGAFSLKTVLYAVLFVSYIPFFGAMFAMMTANIIVHSVSDRIFTDISKVPQFETAIVLGTTKIDKYDDYVYESYIFRIDAAAALYLNGKVKKIIVSGAGYDHKNNFVSNQVFSMKYDLVNLGIKPEDIIEDHAGFRTLDSVLRARDTYKIKDPIFVSQYSHCARAIYQAQENGYKAYGFSRDRFMPLKAQIRYNYREAKARVLAILDTQIFKTKAKTYTLTPNYSSNADNETENVNK